MVSALCIGRLSVPGRPLLASSEVDVRLNIAGYFAKPVRNSCKAAQVETGEVQLISNRNIRLNEVMRIYERLRRSDPTNRVWALVLFPEGVVYVAGKEVTESYELRDMLVACCKRDKFHDLKSFSPLILFPRLPPEDNWRTDKPSAEQRGQYLALLKEANSFLNAAGVAHLDERPDNIMWRQRRDADLASIELRLIDFEDAVLFHDPIPSELVKIIVSTCDRRYPFREGDESTDQLASALHNDFFYQAVKLWTSSEVESFDDFMHEAGAGILDSLSQHPSESVESVGRSGG